jgi:CHAT domain-containing protein
MQRVDWKTILNAPRIRADVALLAACETMRRPASPNTRALTLAEAFAVAGARDVVATLLPIADRDARELFLAVHRSLVSGDDAVAALRRAQLDAIRDSSSHGFPAWAGVAVLTTRIPVVEAAGRNHGRT